MEQMVNQCASDLDKIIINYLNKDCITDKEQFLFKVMYKIDNYIMNHVDYIEKSKLK